LLVIGGIAFAERLIVRVIKQRIVFISYFAQIMEGFLSLIGTIL